MRLGILNKLGTNYRVIRDAVLVKYDHYDETTGERIPGWVIFDDEELKEKHGDF